MSLPLRPVLCLLLLAFQLNATAMFTTLAETAAPHFFTGNELLNQRADGALVRMYVAGVIDGNARLTIDDSSRRYCLPENGTLSQYADVVVQYLTRNPATRHQPAAYLVRNALEESFRCPPK